MRGSVVSDGREATVSLKVIGAGSDRDSSNIQVAIDTGFTGHLKLPPETVRSLSLPERGFVEVELADGGMATLGVYEARVLWHWRPLRVPVYEADGAPLIECPCCVAAHSPSSDSPWCGHDRRGIPRFRNINEPGSTASSISEARS